jgi:hypothetical protein
MDPASDLDPTPDPIPSFRDFNDAKKNFLHIFFLQLTHRHIIFSILKMYFFAKISVKILFSKHYFSRQSAQHIYEEREGSGAGSVALTNGSGSRSGRPKNMRIRISTTGYETDIWCRIREADSRPVWCGSGSCSSST